MSRQATENVRKLPKWAQDKIKVLEMRVSELKTTLTQLGSAKPTDTRVINYGTDEPDTNLPNHSHIEFKPKDGEPIEVCLRHDDTEGIVVTSAGYGSLRVMPWATNVVKIYVEKK